MLLDFAPKTVFSRLYRGVCDVARIEHGTTPEVREKFITAVEGEFERGFCDLLEQGVPVARLHLDTLKLLQTSLVELKSHRSCLCCLMRTPEKVLSCKHALCDVCVQTFGIPSVSEKYTFTIHACPLCGAIEDDVFTFIPPTAGTRILTLDGGGGSWRSRAGDHKADIRKVLIFALASSRLFRLRLRYLCW